MANDWNIPPWLEKKVKDRDKYCVYCNILLKEYPHTKGNPRDKATFEHIDNNEKNISEENIAMCCSSCNSSKGPQKLQDWLKSESPTFKKKKITEETIAPIIKKYLGR